MVLAERPRYIAAGCLVVDRAASNGNVAVAPQIWNCESLPELKQWHHFCARPEPGPNGQEKVVGDGASDNLQGKKVLAPEIQSLLLSSKLLAPLKGLLFNFWIELSFGISQNGAQAIIRVYVLPDDVDNRLVPRSNHALRKARSRLMGQLDYSPNTWRGDPGAGTRTSAPPIFGEASDADTQDNSDSEPSESLLQMFNNLPSPDPRPETVEDPDVRDAMHRLLDSDISGLNITLFSYQRRSAALMLQRESQPGRVLDPRLLNVVDQNGEPWYYDSVAGVVLCEPRYYDGPCGGILAEQMGSGKTVICLALILATKHIPARAPEMLRQTGLKSRPRVGSLADMAAACITRNSVPWKPVLQSSGQDFEYTRCIQVILRNRAFYYLPRPEARRATRNTRKQPADKIVRAKKIFLSNVSLVVVPYNLVRQWEQEIAKHTSGLKFLVFAGRFEEESATIEQLLDCDVVLFSSNRLAELYREPPIGSSYGTSRSHGLQNQLGRIRFKRCIVDEGHRLGKSTSGNKSNLHLLLDSLEITARWIVTGTPSKGLFGVDAVPSPVEDGPLIILHRQPSAELEKDDLRRIGSIATFYLRMRPWAPVVSDEATIERPVAWSQYVKQPSQASRGDRETLKAILESLVVRNRLFEISNLLPVVEEKFVYLDGCFQDILVLNLFSAIIIFNAVQSQRSDQDYFFHPSQKKAVLELVSNLRQSSFFGGSFFSPAEILNAVETASGFLDAGKVAISAEDDHLLREAIKFGRIAAQNTIKDSANLFREVPIHLENFPWGAGQSWSLDNKEGDPVLTDSRMALALQKFLHPLADSPTSLQVMFETGRFAARGQEERTWGIEAQDSAANPTTQRSQPRALAGNTQMGQDHNAPEKRRAAILGTPSLVEQVSQPAEGTGGDLAEPLAKTQMVSTASAKLSYLIDQIIKYKDSEQIIIFYENDNTAYYLAGILDILQIHHLIYAKGIKPERRTQYVATFNSSPLFRVMLMDITQAAFGIDMRTVSRIYFINPVLNPQVEAQAIGRARRIGQNKPVTVETLVLRGSLEEVIVKRRGEMTQEEQWKCRSILDDRPIYEWVLNAKILPLPGGENVSDQEQMATLDTPQFIFGRGFGRESHPDQDLVTTDGGVVLKEGDGVVNGIGTAQKRAPPAVETATVTNTTPESNDVPPPKKKARVRFAGFADDTGGVE
ncbi:SNF2 family N-terminal domain-containing protein [Lasiosphaeria miniovina]|uniref:SNF2 family N-terminal domain-containing protein n=1 Tax=Lasiosphaeria miniovina TaxID=1954250 RepID=A0AA40AJB3_9PEZI|nr:SNF2 family N-terminal domain-containing protein [Lasiosphaeria miniovina]KAK0716941.1 SNF2 family N-terminal domain-containing protein [Lasiosphaeria miniovina]